VSNTTHPFTLHRLLSPRPRLVHYTAQLPASLCFVLSQCPPAHVHSAPESSELWSTPQHTQPPLKFFVVITSFLNQRPKSHKNKKLLSARFQALTAACMKMTVFWNIAPYSLVEVDRRFRGCCLNDQLTVEAVHISKTSVYFNETTKSCISESCHLQDIKKSAISKKLHYAVENTLVYK
jgi:hypothetical protein